MSLVFPEVTMSIFDDFDILSETYVTHGTTAVQAKILVPKSLPRGTHPVIINFHGGGLVTGDALFPPFFPFWLLPFAKEHGAIIVSADYTLLPAPKGLAAIMDDIETFWSWLHSKFPVIFSSRAPGQKVDLDHILVEGGSAGGYVATSLALSHPKEIRALAIAYPMLDFDSEWFKRGSLAVGAPNIFGMPDEAFLTKEEAHALVARLAEGPVTSEGGPERMGVYGAAVREGMMWDLFDPEKALDKVIDVWPIRRVKAGAELPERVWVMHGDADTGVPVDGSRVFFDEASKVDSARHKTVRLDIVPGMDHGFDSLPAPEKNWKGPEDPLIKDALAWLAEVWLE